MSKGKWFLGIGIILLLVSGLIGIRSGVFYSKAEPTFYYQENFQSGVKGWKMEDVEWKNAAYDHTGVVQLKRKDFVSPHLMTFFSTKNSPPETLVFHTRVRIHAFTEEAMTLATIYFPMGPVAVITNQEGRVGVAEELFGIPEYSKDVLGSLEKDKWEDLYVYINNTKKKLTLYVNSQQVLERKWDKPSYPVQEIWLGSIWIKGGGNYGAPLDVCYDEIGLGDEELLPRAMSWERMVYTLAGTSFVFLILGVYFCRLTGKPNKKGQ